MWRFAPRKSKWTVIRLLVDVPVDSKYGMTTGRILNAKMHTPSNKISIRWSVRGDTGEEVGIMSSEAEEILVEN